MKEGVPDPVKYVLFFFCLIEKVSFSIAIEEDNSLIQGDNKFFSIVWQSGVSHAINTNL